MDSQYIALGIVLALAVYVFAASRRDDGEHFQASLRESTYTLAPAAHVLPIDLLESRSKYVRKNLRVV